MLSSMHLGSDFSLLHPLTFKKYFSIVFFRSHLPLLGVMYGSYYLTIQTIPTSANSQMATTESSYILSKSKKKVYLKCKAIT